MKSTKKIVSLVLVLVLAMTSCFALASCGKEKNVIYIGASGPLTGDAAVYGVAVKNAAELAVKEINDAGGLNGYTLKFVCMDDKHDASNVSPNYAKMLQNGMKVSLGCVTTAPCQTFKSLSKEDNVFFLTPSASGDVVVEYDNAYQMCFADSNQGIAAAEYVNTLGKSKIGVLYRSDDPYSTGIYNKFRATLNSSITLVEANFAGDVPASFASQINLLKECDFIFMPIYSAPAAKFMTEAKNDVPAKAVYYGCDGLDGIDSLEGFDITSIPQEVSFLSHFNSLATDGKAKEFIDKYVAAYGKDTLNQFAASAYDCIYAIYAALKVAANNGLDFEATPSEYCEALKTVFQGDFSFTGVTGKEGTAITWDEHGFAQKTALPYVVKEAN